MIAAACGSDDDSGDDPTTTTAAPTTTAAATTTTAAPTTTAATTTTTEAFQKPYGGQAIYGQDQEPPTLNTFVPGGNNTVVAIIGQTWWAGVQDIDGFTLELVPDVVTELPTTDNGGVTVNSDGTMTVRYQIRDEAVWADGVPISGDDFQFTLETILDPDSQANTTTYEDIVDSVAGPKTFEYTLSAPTVQYELIFGTLVPKHDVEGSSFINDWNDVAWVSGGPFEFDQWQKGEFVRMTRNENFWKTDPETGQQLPYLDEIIFRFIPETESLINAFKAREVDLINPPPSIGAIEELQELTDQGASVEVLRGTVWEHLNFQFGPGRLERNPDSVNDNLAFRKAVAHAVDKQAIVNEILAGQVEPLNSHFEVFIPSLSNRPWEQYDYNVDKAIAFVEQAKAETGKDTLKTIFSTTSNNDARVTLSQLFVDMFGDVGIEYEIQLEDSQLYFGETLDNGLYDLGEWAWGASPGLSGLISIMDIFDSEQKPPGGTNYYRWGTDDSSIQDAATQEYHELRTTINSTVDVGELETALQRMEQILADNVVYVPLYARLDPGAVWADELAGYKHNPTSANDTWNVELWYRADA